MIRATCLSALLALPAFGQTAVEWVVKNTDVPLQVEEVAKLTMAPGGLVVADALIADQFEYFTRIATPAGPARFVVAIDKAQDGRPSKAMLVFSDAPVACGQDVATVGIDSGLAAFFDRATLKAVNHDGAALGPGKDIYNDWFYALIGDKPVVAGPVPLPSGAVVPMVSSGWGDGAYPVATLNDANGQIVAVYADFMGRDDEGTWLLPPPCPGA